MNSAAKDNGIPCGSRYALFISCLAGAAAIVHAELIDVFRSPFWYGVGLLDAIAVAAFIVILAIVTFASCTVLLNIKKRLQRHDRPSPILNLALVYAVSASIGVAYIIQGGEAALRLSLLACGSLLILQVSGRSNPHHPILVVSIAIAATYGCAEWLYAYPSVRAQTLIWLGPLFVLGFAIAVEVVALSARRFSTRTIATAIGLVVTAAAVGTHTSQLVASTESDKPESLILVTFDALRADYTNTYGGRVETPALDAIANQGIVFEHAYSLAPWTVPSMQGLFASRYPAPLSPNETFDAWRSAVASYRFEHESPTIAEQLQQRGYATAAYVGNPLLGNRAGIMRGFDTGRAWPAHSPLPTGPFTHLPGMRGILKRWLAYEPRIRPIDNGVIIAKSARRFIRAQRGRPYFLWVHLIDPHDPYDPPHKYRTQPGPWPLFSPASPYWGTPQLDAYGNVDIREEDRAFVRSLYEGDIAYADQRLGEILDTVDPQTYVCVTADHGEELWDHGRYGHGQSLYDELVRVPLLFRGKGIKQDRVVEPVSLIDVTPTLAKLMHFEQNPEWEGQSLAPMLFGDAAAERLCFAQATNRFAWPNTYRMARVGPIKIIENVRDGSLQVFDLVNDPNEQVNLSISADPRVHTARKTFANWLKNRPHISTHTTDDADAETIDMLKSMGYID